MLWAVYSRSRVLLLLLVITAVRSTAEANNLEHGIWSTIAPQRPGQLSNPEGPGTFFKELGLKDHDYYGFWGLSP